jgi:type II secretory pathway pseudopilin PulG
VRGFVKNERGFALLDMLVACALLAIVAIAGATAFGARPARAHSAAIALEAAMAEARSLAAASANAMDPLHPTGATVIVESDPSGIAGATRIAVYRSRPVIFNGQTPYPPTRDSGFPPERVSGTFTFSGASPTTGRAQIAEPFAIYLSGSGYASIVQLTGPYNENNPPYRTDDPGCAAEGALIAVTDGASSEEHPFGCVGGAYAAN